MKAIFSYVCFALVLLSGGWAMAGDGYEAPVLEPGFPSQAVLIIFGGVVCLCIPLLRHPKRTTKVDD